MANCFLQFGTTKIYPLLPVEYRLIEVRDQRRMRNGQMRTAHFGEKLEAVLSFAELTEAELDALLALAPRTTSVTFVDERGTSRTMVVQGVDRPLVRTAPAVDGSQNTTGPAYYDVTLTLEEV